MGLPVLRHARYEAMCVLYVALTRAKRGLYLLLPEDKKGREPGWASPVNLVRRAVDGEGDGQMAAYRKALAQIFPDAEIEAWLLSTKLGAWVEA